MYYYCFFFSTNNYFISTSFPIYTGTNLYNAWKVTSQDLTQPSAPVLASFAVLPVVSPSQRTTLIPPGPAFLIGIFFSGLATLKMQICVSSDPDAQCKESAVQANELIRAEWNDQRVVTS